MSTPFRVVGGAADAACSSGFCVVPQGKPQAGASESDGVTDAAADSSEAWDDAAQAP